MSFERFNAIAEAVGYEGARRILARERTRERRLRAEKIRAASQARAVSTCHKCGDDARPVRGGRATCYPCATFARA